MGIGQFRYSEKCFRKCGISPASVAEGARDQEDPFSDIDAETQDMSSLNELVQQINPDLTAEEYVSAEEDLTTCFTFDGDSETNWREKLRTTVVSECGSTAKRPALEQEESSDEEEEEQVTSIQSFDTALTLAKDLLLFLLSKGEEKAAEDQQRVISTLEDAKLSSRIKNAKQTSLFDYSMKLN